MQYYLCPRCQFKIAAKKNVCTTCGFNMSSLKSSAPVEEQSTPSTMPKTAFWSKYIGIQPAKEPSQEKPALG
jgi:hypothetical protein